MSIYTPLHVLISCDLLSCMHVMTLRFRVMNGLGESLEFWNRDIEDALRSGDYMYKLCCIPPSPCVSQGCTTMRTGGQREKE